MTEGNSATGVDWANGLRHRSSHVSYVLVGLYDGVVTTTTFGRYLTEVEMARMLHPEWRKGQAHYNVLGQLEPGLSDAVLGTRLDPFQNDRALPGFLAWVEERLAARTAAA